MLHHLLRAAVPVRRADICTATLQTCAGCDHLLTDTILYPSQIRHSPRDLQNCISINLLVLSTRIYHPTLKQVSSVLTMPRLATSPQLKQRSSSPGQGSAVCGAPITAGMFVPKLPVITKGSWF